MVDVAHEARAAMLYLDQVPPAPASPSPNLQALYKAPVK
jgi:hypothetical protein